MQPSAESGPTARHVGVGKDLNFPNLISHVVTCHVFVLLAFFGTS